MKGAERHAWCAVDDWRATGVELEAKNAGEVEGFRSWLVTWPLRALRLGDTVFGVGFCPKGQIATWFA